MTAMRVRHSARLLGQLLRGAVRTGNWWRLALLVVVAMAAVVAAAAAVVVPSATYVLF
ncbi:MAG: hypothetical protein ACOYOQ_15550 [Microthrixaceae bacterium]